MNSDPSQTIVSLDLKAELRKRIEAERRELEAALEEAVKAQKRIEVHRNLLERYERALEAEELQERGDYSLLTSDRHSTVSTPQTASELHMNGYPVTQSSLILDIIRENSAAGITPPEILKTLRDREMKVRPNYLYTLLGRLKERGQVRVAKKRYFPVREKTESMRKGTET